MKKSQVNLNLRFRALKDGFMEGGNIFCHIGSIYKGAQITDGDEKWFELETELYDENAPNPLLHAMDEEFLNEYFQLID